MARSRARKVWRQAARRSGSMPNFRRRSVVWSRGGREGLGAGGEGGGVDAELSEALGGLVPRGAGLVLPGAEADHLGVELASDAERHGLVGGEEQALEALGEIVAAVPGTVAEPER